MQHNDEARELGQFIPVHYHYNMLLDEARMSGFRAALEHVVKPGARVLELGGGTGVLSFFAAARASRVWCVERNPALVREARRISALNPNGQRIEIVQADAFDYLPPEPVDVVVCEMLHVGLLREKQIAVLDSFKRRYLEKFGGPLPAFVPEACVQAVQPIQQDFTYEGYYAPVMLFQNPVATQDRTLGLASPAVFQQFFYDQPLPSRCEWQGEFIAERDGVCNALRLITKNLLALRLHERDSIDWFNAYLVVPLDTPLPVRAGDAIAIEFGYEPGASLEALRPQVAVRAAVKVA